MYWIDNGFLRLEIAAQGAQWRSLQSHGSGRHWLWSGDATYWSGVAPLLFPVIGAMRNGQYRYQGKTYTMPKHGFLRDSTPDLLRHARDEVRFRLLDSEASRAYYPFAFQVDIRYALHDDTLKTTLKVRNRDTVPMPFAIGGHPAFRIPLSNVEQYSDYAIHFNQDRALDVYSILPSGLVSDNTYPLSLPDGVLPLEKSLFDNDALVLKKFRSNQFRLAGVHSGASVTMTIEGFKAFGIWAAPGADFVCLEPWTGTADTVNDSGDISEKEGIAMLPPGEQFRCGFSLRFED